MSAFCSRLIKASSRRLKSAWQRGSARTCQSWSGLQSHRRRSLGWEGLQAGHVRCGQWRVAVLSQAGHAWRVARAVVEVSAQPALPLGR